MAISKVIKKVVLDLRLSGLYGSLPREEKRKIAIYLIATYAIPKA